GFNNLEAPFCTPHTRCLALPCYAFSGQERQTSFLAHSLFGADHVISPNTSRAPRSRAQSQKSRTEARQSRWRVDVESYGSAGGHRPRARAGILGRVSR